MIQGLAAVTTWSRPAARITIGVVQELGTMRVCSQTGRPVAMSNARSFERPALGSPWSRGTNSRFL